MVRSLTVTWPIGHGKGAHFAQLHVLQPQLSSKSGCGVSPSLHAGLLWSHGTIHTNGLKQNGHSRGEFRCGTCPLGHCSFGQLHVAQPQISDVSGTGICPCVQSGLRTEHGILHCAAVVQYGQRQGLVKWMICSGGHCSCGQFVCEMH